MIQAYSMITHFNDSSMFKNKNYVQCPKCNLFVKPTLDLDMNLVIKKIDLSVTYDGVYIASNDFKVFCEDEKLLNLEFIRLNKHNDFWVFKTYNIVEFDAFKRGTKFIGYCEICSQYQEVIGLTPIFLKTKEKLINGIFETDLKFGSQNSKSGSLIAGVETAIKMKGKKFRRCYLKKINFAN